MADLNRLPPEDFVRAIGPIFEQSPWIAAATAARRPFSTRETLLATLCQTVADAPEDKQLDLVQAHPDLVGRAAAAGRLTVESAREQAGAGLFQLPPEEIALFQRHNAAYREKFGFPFVICARLNNKNAILAGFERRLPHSRAREIQTALEEICKIAALRLRDIVED
ncbi:MAG TPA: 2-oxo-4-hydroxy-4-carboxy-5-ureidoimidazoline decarboxylase [Verrucomicrobiae bacterium]